MLPVPFSENICNVFTTYQPCCGKMLCYGCVTAANEQILKKTIKSCCPYCRMPLTKTDKEDLKRLKKRMKLNDAEAFYSLGGDYAMGGLVNIDFMKTLELWNKAAELGSIKAHYRLGFSYFHGEGVEKDTGKALQHYKLAAIGGHEMARYNLGCMEMESNGNVVRAMKHWMIAAKSGLDMSLKQVGLGYKRGYVTKDDYAKTLRAYQESWDEMKSEQRTKAMVIAKQKLSKLPYNKHMNL